MPFDYLNIKPISGPIAPRRQEAKRHYGVHPYFTRRSYNVVQEYIKTFTQPGDLVVDPFGGSGVTAIEALVLRRRAIHIDINPLANFITQCVALSPVDLNSLKDEYSRIDKNSKKYLDYIDSLSDEEAAQLPIKDWYPKNIRLPLNADREFVHELFTPKQLHALAHIRVKIKKCKDEHIRKLLFFILSATLTKCNILFSGAKGRAQSRGNASPIQLYRYWVPSNPVELGVRSQFKFKFNKFVAAKDETNEEIADFYSPENISIYKGDAADLRELVADESADYIYTDPPYGAHIAYLDLSTMWNAWMGFEVTPKDKELEIIENGDLNKTPEDYTQRLTLSIQEIFRILKYERWFSLVFAHKDPLYWDTIIKATEACGFEYVNTSVVRAGIVSYHKHKNPLRVLSGEMVINFVKKQKPRAMAVTRVGVEVVQVIMNSAELSIITREDGATTEDIYNDLIPKLIETGLLTQLRDRISDITPLLGDKFDFNWRTNRWNIPPNTKLGSFIPLNYRLRFYVEAFLNQCARRNVKATLEMIWENVIPLLKNGRQPTQQTLLEELRIIAEPYNRHFWRLHKRDQYELFDETELKGEKADESELPRWDVESEEELEHNEIIYRLAVLADKIDFQPYIGLNERKRGPDADKLSSLSLTNLPKNLKLSPYGRKKVEQIDLIWFDVEGFPAYAFEVEKSTAITSAIERFIELLKVYINVSGKTIIICPSSRRDKLDEVLSQSAFIGSPMFLENKIRYLYFKDIVSIYQECSKTSLNKEHIAVEIRKKLHSPLQNYLS